MAPRSRAAAGTFSVCLPGYLDLDASDLSRIRKVHLSEENDGSYMVEFMYEQDAFRYLKAATKARKAMKKSLAATENSDESIEQPPGLKQSTTTKGLLQSPPGLDQTQCLTGTGHEVELKNLPQTLMSKSMLEATLDQAGLEKDVIGISLSGKVNITFSTRRAAEDCLKHFHGRKWGGQSAGAVTAKIVSSDVSSGKQGYSTPAKATANLGVPTGLPKYAPAYVHIASDASTTVSDEEAEEELLKEAVSVTVDGCE